jgi:hypothetical protein
LLGALGSLNLDSNSKSRRTDSKRPKEKNEVKERFPLNSQQSIARVGEVGRQICVGEARKAAAFLQEPMLVGVGMHPGKG